MCKRFNGSKILIGFLLIAGMAYTQNKDITREAAKASFTIDSKEHDYGNIPENGGLAEHIFVITNTGTTPLVIKQAVASCDCTTPDWTHDPILPQKNGHVKASYDPKGRTGAFDKAITVYINNSDSVQLTIKGTVVEGNESTAEKLPVFTALETRHNFGTIGENDGYAEHIFKFKNTGTAPLVINKVSASCGCTKPEWTVTPVLPGQEGNIIIAYNPKGRLGNFNKSTTVYTNENNGFKRYTLTITGTVVEKPMDPPMVKYVDTVGGVGIEHKSMIYNNFVQNQENKKFLYVKNYNPETVYLSWENIPDYITVNCPDSLKSEWPGESIIVIDGQKTTEKRGRIVDNLLFTVKDATGKVLGQETITATVNYLDDFKQLSPLESVSAPHLDIQNTMINFGKIKKNFLGLDGNGVKEIVLTNTGKSDLTIHSFSSEDERVKLPQIKGKVIAAGASLSVKATIKVKDLKFADIDTDIYIVCNDPKGPVRMIKITAQREK
jgi:hypothetical protein